MIVLLKNKLLLHTFGHGCKGIIIYLYLSFYKLSLHYRVQHKDMQNFAKTRFGMSQKFSMRNWSQDWYSRHLDCCLLLWQDLAEMGVLTFFFAWFLWCSYLNNETLMWWPSICSNPKEDSTPYSMKGSLVVFFSEGFALTVNTYDISG